MREWIRQWLVRFLGLDEFRSNIDRSTQSAVNAGIISGVEEARPKWPYGDVATAEQVAALNALSDDDRADIARKKIEAYAEQFAVSYLPDLVERFVEETLEHRPLRIEIDPINGGVQLKLVKFDPDSV